MSTITFGDWLRRTRERRGLTQDELGRALGTHGRTVSVWECGKQAPSGGAVVQLAAWGRISSRRLGQLLEAQREVDPVVARACARLGAHFALPPVMFERAVLRIAGRRKVLKVAAHRLRIR